MVTARVGNGFQNVTTIEAVGERRSPNAHSVYTMSF